MPAPDPTPLLPFVVKFGEPDFEFGAWGGGQTNDGVTQLPYFAFSADAQGFVSAAYQGNWVRGDIIWHGDEERKRYARLTSEPGGIETANVDEIAHVLTTLIRGDRFNEGMLASAFEHGIVGRVLARVAVLAGNSVV